CEKSKNRILPFQYEIAVRIGPLKSSQMNDIGAVSLKPRITRRFSLDRFVNEILGGRGLPQSDHPFAVQELEFRVEVIQRTLKRRAHLRHTGGNRCERDDRIDREERF